MNPSIKLSDLISNLTFFLKSEKIVIFAQIYIFLILNLKNN